MFVCKICGKKISKNAKGTHLKTHNLTSKEYYDSFLKKKEDGVCKICGKPTRWNNEGSYYSTYCSQKCAYKGNNKKRIKTNLKKYGTSCTLSLSSVQEKIKKTCLEKYGFDNPNKSKLVREKIKETCLEKYGAPNFLASKKGRKIVKRIMLEKYGVCNPLQDNKIHRKMINTVISKYGVDNISRLEETKKKVKETYIKRYGVDSPLKNKEIRNKIKKTNLKRYGVENPSQCAEIHEKQFSNRRKKNHGYLSKAEYEFSKLLSSNKISFKNEYYLNNDNYSHNFDFAIFKKDKLKCLIEIDGEFYHCLVSDCDGVHAISSKDYLRWNLVPPKVKFLVIDSQRLNEGIKELLRILPIKYKDWKKEMIRSIPKNIKDAIPKYDKNRLRNDWNRLCSYHFNKNAFLGKSILLNFCRSRIINLLGEDWKTLRKTLYKSPCSEHNVLEGLDDFRNTSRLREKYRKKYKGIKEIIVKHHSPEKMLAICSLGKNYVSKEHIDKESKRIIKFLNLKVKGF